MLGAGFELIVADGKLYFWFYDPFTAQYVDHRDRDSCACPGP
jgi:hypothetical protein